MSRSLGLCAPVLLLLLAAWRTLDLAEACSCSPVHPQQAFCSADVAIRAKVIGRQEVIAGNDVYGNPIKRIQYDIKQTKMFKGPNREINAIFTGPSSAVCGVNLSVNDKKEYLITGKLESDGTMHVTLCDFIDSYESLTAAQRKGLDSRYEMGCTCRIVRCASIPCSITDDAECLWTDWIMESSNGPQGPQARHYTCIKRNDQTCAWYRGATSPKKEFMDIEDP